MNGFIAPQIAVAPYPFAARGTLERLKLEISVAVWNWERRNGLPHYDGSFRTRIDAAMRAGKARRESAK
ncbi:MAG: hypothetical protein ABI925_11310 [Verrucomicrobiota bacterium]